MTSENNFKRNSKWYHTLGRVLLFWVCSMIILAFCSGLTKSIPSFNDHLSILLTTILTFLLIILFINRERLKLQDIGVFPGKNSISRFVSGYFIGFCMAGLQALIILMYGHFQLKLVPKLSLTDLFSPLLLYFLVACREELAFRSYSIRSLNLSLGPILALTIIGIFFIVEHIAGGMTWKMAIIGSGTGAILFGVSALKTKGIALPLGLHCAWNFGQWTFGFKNKRGIWEAIVEKGYESEIENIGLFAFLLVMAIAIAGVCFYYRKSKLSE